MNSLWDIRSFLGLVPKESPCITEEQKRQMTRDFYIHAHHCENPPPSDTLTAWQKEGVKVTQRSMYCITSQTRCPLEFKSKHAAWSEDRDVSHLQSGQVPKEGENNSITQGGGTYLMATTLRHGSYCSPLCGTRIRFTRWRTVLLLRSNTLKLWFPKCGTPWDPWIHFCNGYFAVYLFLKLNDWFIQYNRGTSYKLTICLFRMTVRISNQDASCTHEASDKHVNEGQITSYIDTYATVMY